MRSLLVGLLLFAVACCTSPEYAEKAKVDRILRSAVCVQVAHKVPNSEQVQVGIGSGFIAAHSHDATFIISAGHVCKTTSPAAVQVSDVFGHDHEANVLLVDPRDVCVLVSPGTWGQVAPIARANPYLGAPVLFAGATRGFWARGQAVLTDARYSGPTRSDSGLIMTVLSGVTTTGSSGAAVFHAGEVTGIVVSVLPPAMTPIMVVPFDVLTADLRAVLAVLSPG